MIYYADFFMFDVAGLVWNGLSVLELASLGDSRVTVIGDAIITSSRVQK